MLTLTVAFKIVFISSSVEILTKMDAHSDTRMEVDRDSSLEVEILTKMDTHSD